jgi:phosphatidylglycerophosphatase A
LDIIKPPPARWVERNMRGGAAVMLDDLVAAVYANLALQALVRLW